MLLRPEYPRPLLVRPRWRNLNGEWELGHDPTDRGLRDGWEQRARLHQRVAHRPGPGVDPSAEASATQPTGARIATP
ncbi:MAG: hypothetical protein ABFS46_18635, partial [Myxococcota bacterium]